jgi:hypothetical protein
MTKQNRVVIGLRNIGALAFIHGLHPGFSFSQATHVT